MWRAKPKNSLKSIIQHYHNHHHQSHQHKWQIGQNLPDLPPNLLAACSLGLTKNKWTQKLYCQLFMPFSRLRTAIRVSCSPTRLQIGTDVVSILTHLTVKVRRGRYRVQIVITKRACYRPGKVRGSTWRGTKVSNRKWILLLFGSLFEWYIMMTGVCCTTVTSD